MGVGSGLRLAKVVGGPGHDIMVLPVIPERINARIVFDRDAIRAHGFGGGGTFTLFTPEFSLGEGTPTTGAILPFDFFSTAGFANYNITSFKTEITPSTFTNGYGGYNAVLATQTVTVGAGQTLLLSQSVLPDLAHMSSAQALALRDLASGGDLRSVLSPVVPTAAWDQKAVNLTLGGLMELHVAEGGLVTGAAGSSLTVGGLVNDGIIRIAGGTVTQRWDLPSPYVTGLGDLTTTGSSSDAIGFRDFSDIFTVNADGTIDPKAASKYSGSNQQLAANRPVYKLGLLDQGEGIRLGANSVIDLSGTIIRNPYVTAAQATTDGRIIGGGTLASLPPQWLGGWRYDLPYYQTGGTLSAAPGAVIDLSGAAGVLRQPTANGYVQTEVWSNGGMLSLGAGAILAGIDIRAHGGNAQAQGGTLQMARPVLTQHDTPTLNAVSADLITRSGFDTLIAMGGITSSGDATVTLDRAFILMPQPWEYAGIPTPGEPERIMSPTISTGGDLIIDAPYIGLLNT
ncbi:MAG: hypothetical protein G4V63_30975, partial [Candidatus Afipia apatlaquensis]|nr:hypothetical protein [Candidatus Afipia apatlaquensis]